MLRKLAYARPVAVLGGLLFSAISALRNTGLTFWAYYWFTWFFGLFLIPELYWVFNGPQNTLSDNTWRFESLDFKHPFDFAEWTPAHWVFGAIFLLLMLWLFFHLVFGFFR